LLFNPTYRIDNSEWMRNGDFPPNRMDAQKDAVTFLFNAKTQSNPENTVGLLTNAGKQPEVLVTLTNDLGKILTALHGVKIGGQNNITTAVQIAQVRKIFFGKKLLHVTQKHTKVFFFLVGTQT
jgi:26S proteasome regulatory subunit N10